MYSIQLIEFGSVNVEFIKNRKKKLIDQVAMWDLLKIIYDIFNFDDNKLN